MKNQITSETKKTLLEAHFFYEFNQMRAGFYRIINKGVFIKETNTINVDNHVLIDFLLHVRILYEFFYKNNKGDFAHAKDYFPNWKIKYALEGIETWNIQLNHYLAHLSYVRVTSANGKHPYRLYPAEKLYSHFRNLTIEFLDKIPKEYLQDNLIKLLNELKIENEKRNN